MKAQNKSQKTSTVARSQRQTTSNKERVRQPEFLAKRRAYLRNAGYVEEPDPESEAMLPREIQLDPEPLDEP